ncbi:hypothetical protein HUS23_00790 [Ectothiorhodospiraceae bacterium 2226]|nr:hypothetical protein HUS23_00790 [Ectothiorhodospiraceae bacterium 2226]
MLDPGQGRYRYIPDAVFWGEDSFEYRVTDAHGRTTAATMAITVERAEALFNATFPAGGLPDGWVQANPVDVVDGSTYPYQWRGEDGKRIRQTYANDVFRASRGLAGGHSLGGVVWWADGVRWEDYRFEADVEPPEHGGEVGLVFRVQDQDVDYRLSLSAQSTFIRLERREGAPTDEQSVPWTPLATSARGYQHGPLQLTVDVRGPLIRVFVDGVETLTVRDEDPLLSGSIGLYARHQASFDNVRIETLAERPSIAVTHPQPFTTVSGPLLRVEGALADAPSAAEVRIQLREAAGGRLIAQATRPAEAESFAADFGGLPAGDAILDVELLLDGEVLAFTTREIGLNGKTWLAVGDSIHNGHGDNFPADNRTSEGRMIGTRGMGAVLAEALSVRGLPTVVMNEAVPGDESDHTAKRIHHYVERHAAADAILLLVGTNDAGAATEGRTASHYRIRIRRIVDTVLSMSGPPILAARVPPRFGDRAETVPYSDPHNHPRNVSTREYNAVLDQEGLPGPDLYHFFIQGGRVSLYADNTHPNSLGHRILAALWQRALADVNAPLPFFVDSLEPFGYRQDLRRVDDPVYVRHLQNADGAGYLVHDDGARLRARPSFLERGIWILPDSGASANMNGTGMRFTLDRPATVYVAYDANASIVPTWLNDAFAPTGDTVRTTDGILTLWQQRIEQPGEVSLGANRADGASGAMQYLVIVVPSQDVW